MIDGPLNRQDLQEVVKQVLRGTEMLLESRGIIKSNRCQEGYKTKDVRRILGCSVNKLVSLRIAKKIRWKKIGGTGCAGQCGT
jgi:hypothetical protein